MNSTTMFHERSYCELDHKWTVNGTRQIYTSPAHKDRDEQRLIFGETFADFSISGDVIWRDGLQLPDGGIPRVAAFAFRFRDRENYYFAGMGAYGKQYSIAKVVEGCSHCIDGVGSSSSIQKDRSYRLTVECEGSRITLRENDEVQLTVDDDTFQAGQWGLRTWRTKADFKALTCNPVFSSRVFIVHGHDAALRNELARLLEKLDLQPIILHEEPDRGQTIIEKLGREINDVGFAFVLLTPDDVGAVATEPTALRHRARQNVVFEHGLLVGRFSHSRVCAIRREDVEMPSDLHGIVYKTVPVGGRIDAIAFEIVKELKAAGYTIDANRLLSGSDRARS